MLTRVYKKVSPYTLPHTFEPEPMHLYTFLHAPPVPSNLHGNMYLLFYMYYNVAKL